MGARHPVAGDEVATERASLAARPFLPNFEDPARKPEPTLFLRDYSGPASCARVSLTFSSLHRLDELSCCHRSTFQFPGGVASLVSDSL